MDFRKLKESKEYQAIETELHALLSASVRWYDEAVGLRQLGRIQGMREALMYVLALPEILAKRENADGKE